MASESSQIDPATKPNDTQPGYISDYNDIRGWWHAYFYGTYAWRNSHRPRLYYPAGYTYVTGQPYIAVDGMGRIKKGDTAYDCTINPSTGKFEPLCVQTTDSLCAVPNSTWDRTIIRNGAPRLFRLASFAFRGIPVARRHDLKMWTKYDWASVTSRWVPSSLGIFILLLMPSQEQPHGKNPYAYLHFMYNGYRYPRLALNFWENREAVQAERPNDPSWTSGDIGMYRVFRPRYLCYIVETSVQKNDGSIMAKPYFEVRPVRKNDHTPYVFISFSMSQFQNPDDIQRLYAMSMMATRKYAKSVQEPERKPRAFWIAYCCQPSRIYIEEEELEQVVDSEDQKRYLTNQDVYSMSDIIRGAEHTIIITNARNSQAAYNLTDEETLQEWGERVWTLPEVILSKGDNVTLVNGQQPKQISKLGLAELAWTDKDTSRQLVEHFTNLPLSRLELVSIAMKCLKDRNLMDHFPGDRSYALMGLLRLRPKIDCSDSSFQAFARLSLPQDNDRLMERLICLLPENLDEPWDKMSDQYKSTLWEIYPDTQVCGIGENDTVIVDGCRGAMIQWSMLSTVHTMKNMTLKRKSILYTVMFTPALFILGCLILVTSRTGGIVILVIASIIILAAPAYVPHIYVGKLRQVEPCLFGIEGYVPLDEIEEVLFGAKLGRMSWSPFGSPLSRHVQGDPCHEPIHQEDLEGGASQPLPTIDTYPVKAIDPCSPCARCTNEPQNASCRHATFASVKAKSLSPPGNMKVFTLIDTFSMTVTLFEARCPPVVLIIGGSEGGRKRALACSYDITTGTLYRETVLRVPSQTVARMHFMQRIRLGLKKPFMKTEIKNM